jgi:uncharacterized membrane protein
MKTAPLALLLLFAGALAVIFAAPCLASAGFQRAQALGYAAFFGLCHQLPERSLDVCGNPMPVCARCFGLYSGLLAGTAWFASGRKRPHPKWLLFALAPMALEVAAEASGAASGTNGLRLATGLISGLALPAYIVPAFSEAVGKLNHVFIGIRR